MSDLRDQCIQDFGEQWTAYGDSEGYYGSDAIFDDSFGPLLTMAQLKDLRILDIGAGTGRVTAMLLRGGASHVVAVEPSASGAKLMEHNLAAWKDRLTVLPIGGEQVPPSGDMDLVVSYGVLHHIPDPGPAVRAAWHALKPGGRLVVWLYGREGNLLYLALVLPLRRLTKRLPHRLLAALSWLLVPPVSLYIQACKVLPLPLHLYMTRVMRRFDLRKRQLVIYDQLNPAYARYYTREEAYRLLADQGFSQVQLHHRHEYSWVAMGIRP